MCFEITTAVKIQNTSITQKGSLCPFVNQVVILLLLIVGTIIEHICALHFAKPFKCIISHFALRYNFVDEETEAQLLPFRAQVT